MNTTIPSDYTFCPLLNRVIGLAHRRVKPAGSTACASTATISAALSILFAIKLGCTVEAAIVGRVSCADSTYWLVTVRPHFGRCDLLDCLHCGSCDACDALDELTPDLHGTTGLFAHNVVPALAAEWAYQHADFVAAVAERLGARSNWTVANLLDGLDLPPTYNFERDFGKDTQRTAGDRP